ncbi:DUF58 domain-containing protein [Shouchella lonarensis]|uniref:Uncharacterized conserved protein, DUF58 family, contains vWF domain n=1 Tax=Shouchella lonarensis TaxID=1464122 RepID=A0A1G6HV95_9BACI|nr:DUF58 domain-containing protein [Shouchella lonarensis]SDB98227.1 Uncharacterized conserved protein, DUF58 family, contains vWF domain [Shouchella lonarensis]
MKRTKMSMQMRRWLFACLLFAASFVYALFRGGFVSWFLFYAIVSVVLFSCIVSFLSLWGIQVARQISTQEVPCFSHVDVKVMIKKQRWLPAFCYEVVDQVPKRLQATKTQRAWLSPSLRKQVSFSYVVQATVRGQHIFPRVNVTVHDLFGLLALKRTIPVTTEMLVYPAYCQLDDLAYADVKEQTTRKWLHQQEDYAFAGIRAYEPGDRLARVDWKRSAGVTGLFTKMFETEAHEQAIVIAFPYAGRAKDEATFVRFEQAVSSVTSIVATLTAGQVTSSLLFYNQGWQTLSVSKSSWSAALRTLSLLSLTENEVISPQDIVLTHEKVVVFLVIPIYTSATEQVVRSFLDRAQHVYVTIASRISMHEQETLEAAGAMFLHVPQQRYEQTDGEAFCRA